MCMYIVCTHIVALHYCSDTHTIVQCMYYCSDTHTMYVHCAWDLMCLSACTKWLVL